MSAYLRVLEENNITEEELFSLVKEQIELIGKIPFERYQYDVNCERPQDESRFPVLQEIHPLKRAEVEKILNSNIPADVHKIIVFGSSVTIHCKPTSDLDFCVVGDWNAHREISDPWIRSLKLGPKDVLYMTDEEYTNDNNPAFMGFKIKAEGVVIYEREPSGC